MKLSLQKLKSHLNQALAPLYFISGDEILLIQDALTEIKEAAFTAGFSERIVITAEAGMDWEKKLYEETHGFSLFSNKKMVELNLMHIKLNANHGKILENYAQNLPSHSILIIATLKTDAKIEKSAWYQHIEQKGVVLPIWPISAEQLPQWLIQRAKKINLTLSKRFAEELALLVEGNLLAAVQEIEKLSLLQINGSFDFQTIDTLVTDNTRFDIFNLVDSALAGMSEKCLRILKNLCATQTEPTLILWALTRELRQQAAIKNQLKSGVSLNQLFTQFRIWEKRQPMVRAFLQRHDVQMIWACLVKAAKIDRMIKGADIGNVWDELQMLTLIISGKMI